MIDCRDGIPQECPNCHSVQSFDVTLELDSYAYIWVNDDGTISVNNLTHLMEDPALLIRRLACVSCGQALSLSEDQLDTIADIVCDTFPDIVP